MAKNNINLNNKLKYTKLGGGERAMSGWKWWRRRKQEEERKKSLIYYIRFNSYLFMQFILHAINSDCLRHTIFLSSDSVFNERERKIFTLFLYF